MNEQEWHKTANAQHEMNEQKMREDFMTWYELHFPNCQPSPIEALVWQAACASNQKEIEGLQAAAKFWNDRANDNQQRIHELAAQIEMMRKALDSRKVIGFVRGYDVVLREESYSDDVPVFTLDIRLLQAAQITPSEALAQRDAELCKEITND